MKIVITGLPQVDAALRSLDAKLGNKAVRKALRAGTKIVAEAAKSKVPVKTGALRKSIKVRAGKKSRKGFTFQVNSGADGTGPAFYGRFVELGTKKMPAQPFLRPALYDNENAVRKEFERAVLAEIAAMREVRG